MYGTLNDRRHDLPGPSRTVTTDETIDDVRNYFDKNPNTSIRKAAQVLDLKRETLRKIMRDVIKLHPYKITTHQLLTEKAMEKRKSAALLQRMSNVCAKYKLKSPLIKKHFLYNAKHNSLYCWIRKVASTSFTKLFSDMSNRQVNNNLYKEIDFLSPKSLRDLLHFTRNNVVFKLLVVRHPFHRLVSSYRDRIEDNSKYTAQAWLYVRQILHLTRPELFHSNSSSSNVLQQMFLTDRKLKIVPSFREFLEWLLKQPPGHDDVHWTPYHTHCAVCDVSYNFILKLDEYTFGDVNYILSKMKLDKSKIYLPRLQRTRTGVTDFNTTCRYFYNLSTDMVLRLYERDKRCKQFWSDRELLKDNKQSGHSSEIND
nr:PREDICTED: carbohydrate sulfotransferase 11-like isoform X2 [Linepithema humile]